MALDVAEELEHKGAAVGGQGRVGAVEQRAGQVQREGHQRLKGLCREKTEGQGFLTLV